MDRVFVSSVMGGFEAERAAVRDAIESLDLRPVMAENAPASIDPSRTALLGRVDESDAVVLVLGARYGYVTASGRSPTEDEFLHAVEKGKPVLVFVQRDVEREAAQDAFVARVQGSWEEGAFTAFFRDPTELGYAVVKALNNLKNEAAPGNQTGEAQARAASLASSTGGRDQARERPVRIVVVPVGSGRLIDAVALDDGKLADAAAAALRTRGIVDQSCGIESRSSGTGISLVAKSRSRGVVAVARVESDGAAVVEASAPSEGSMGSMAFAEPSVARLIGGGSMWAGDVWGMLPAGAQVRQAAIAAAALEAQYAAWSRSGRVGNSMSMPTIASPLIVPSTPLVLRRADLAGDAMVKALLAEFRQAFADAGGVVD